jgi:hypothetical protein
MTRPYLSGILAAHYAEQHPCCWIVAPEYVQCGLWCGHDGAHLPYVPGEYLPVPELHPLDVLRLTALSPWRPWWLVTCPVCGTDTKSWLTHREAGDLATFVGGEWRVQRVLWWRFQPCGCEAREVLP